MSQSIPLPLVDGDTLLIDNSSLEYQTTCPRAAMYYICLRRETSKDRAALNFGKIIHSALDVRYRAVTAMHAQTPQVEATMLAAVAKGFSEWSPPEDEFRNHSFAVELINRYGVAYPFESFDVLRLSDGQPFVEVPFAVPLGAIEIHGHILVKDVATGEIAERYVHAIQVVWTGKIDLAYRSNGGVYIMDHKTTSMMGPSFFQDFEMSHQMYGYVWATEALLNEQVTGVCINALATRKPTKTGKALEFERKVHTVSRPHLTEWQQDCINIVSDFIYMVTRGYMPKHTKWCFGKYGMCQYHPVCSLPPTFRETLLHSGEYQQVIWSPLNNT